MNSTEKKKVLGHFVEFLILGVCMGVVEDLIAIYFATNAEINLYTFKVAFLVAFPFAVIAEVLVDLKIFRRIFFRK
ncbi:MAG: hypothetical protein P8Y17_01940 [Patescibacteria group bacterium]